MRKRLLSLLLAVVMMVSLMTAIQPEHVHADGYKCGWCDTYYPEDEDVMICFNCYVCENCADICEECMACYLCATELGFHCEECNESCVDEAYGNVPHCVMCMRCEFCVELKETSDGLMCEECIKENADNDGNTMCEHCGNNVIYNDEDGEDDDCAPCGVHCIECYEEFYCSECDECTLCTGEDLCETCGICLQCAFDNGYHCQYCGECYGDVGQCHDEGDHCVNCCEDVCENCGNCTWALEIGYCETCELCEECWEHCEICEECMKEVGRCESDGDHCRECCASEGWLCDQCERCTEALDLSFCEYCGLCEECCKKNSEYYGVSKCILDDETDPEELDTSKHDKNHHIIVYECIDDGTHDGHCIFPGCDYKITEHPHTFVTRTLEEATIEKTGRKENTCIQCGYQEVRTIPKVDPPEYYFIKQPTDIESLPNNKRIDFYIEVGQVGTDEAPKWRYLRIGALPILDDEKLPETVAEYKESGFRFYDYDLKTYSYKEYGMSYEAGSTVFPGSLYHKSSAYDGKFKDYEAQGKNLTWRLAVYDWRGGKIVYSEPFTINWKAKHNQHTTVWVCGKLSPYEKNMYGHLVETDHSAHALYWYDGTYHWRECTVCHGRITYPENHHYSLTEIVGDCVDAVYHYTCVDCGHVLEKVAGRNKIDHIPVEGYFYDKVYHWQFCSNPKCTNSQGHFADEDFPIPNTKQKHDFEKIVNRYCDKIITIAKCKTCGYTYIENEPGPGHTYSNDGPMNGWYVDKIDHWQVCTKCGYINKHHHSYYDGHCKTCGIAQPQMVIVGGLCQHGVLHIEKTDSIQDKQAAQFDAGRYGVTWIDADTDETLGIGKTYELSAADEGREIRAEITFMDTDGWEWWEKDLNAYMDGMVITTKYKSVNGYAATCISTGVKAHKVCEGCGKKFLNGKEVSDVTIAKTGHTYDNACDKFCNVCGKEREAQHTWSANWNYVEEGHYKYCTVCGEQTSIIPHEISYEIISDPHSCDKEGLRRKKCDICGLSIEETIPAEGHDFVHMDAAKATCMSEGCKEHYLCSKCGTRSYDDKGTTTFGLKEILVPKDPNNHIGGDLIGYNENEHYTICACGEHIDNAPHTFGEDDRCTVCHYKKGSAVKTGGKTLTEHARVAPTCVSTGTKRYYTDENGKIYLSKEGVIEVTAEELVIPIDPAKHVGGDLEHDKTRHWIHCACGEKIMIEDHAFDENQTCTVCGYKVGEEEEQETPEVPEDSAKPAPTPTPDANTPGTNDNDKTSPLPWIIAIIVALLLAGAAVVVILIVLKKKKEQAEK